jgi:hypothetical protein
MGSDNEVAYLLDYKVCIDEFLQLGKSVNFIKKSRTMKVGALVYP